MGATGDANSYFAPDFFDARREFLDAARAAPARISSYVHPMSGPDGQELATDVAEFGPEGAGQALIVCSGTHGIEGFSGSAIQLGLMREGWPDRLPTDTKLILIHAINPFGFAYLRRFNEDNVDLNRNFLKPGQALPENPGYDVLADSISPETLSLHNELAALIRLVGFAVGNGFAAAREAVTGGQYRHPEGLFYGGHGPTWSALTLRTIIEKHGRGLSRALFFDVHTGLGPKGNAEIISNSPKASEQYARACSIWGNLVKTTKEGESVSADLAGTLKLGVIRMLPEAEMTAVSIEYGTVPALVALRALRDENWLHHLGESGTPRARRIKRNLLAAFNPDDNAWRAAVWRKGSDAVTQALNWLRDRPALT